MSFIKKLNSWSREEIEESVKRDRETKNRYFRKRYKKMKELKEQGLGGTE